MVNHSKGHCLQTCETVFCAANHCGAEIPSGLIAEWGGSDSIGHSQSQPGGQVNCRMGGGPVRNINLLVWGVDMVEEHLLTTAGIPVRPPVASKPLKNIAEFSSNAKKTGTVQNDDFCKV